LGGGAILDYLSGNHLYLILGVMTLIGTALLFIYRLKTPIKKTRFFKRITFFHVYSLRLFMPSFFNLNGANNKAINKNTPRYPIVEYTSETKSVKPTKLAINPTINVIAAPTIN